jgi:organic radical activating enzyme
LSNINNAIFEEGRKLPLIEDFYTVQGEGYQTGKSAYFIRVGGCDIGCKWCDTKFSWDPNVHTLTDVKAIVEKAKQYPAKTVVVTGGEPSTYDLDFFCKEMKDAGVATFIETSGVYNLSGEWDWICLSPKKHNPPVDNIFQKAHELKVIIYNDDDFEWAEKCSNLVNDNCKLYLQPEWSRFKNNVQKIVDFVKQNPKWGVSLQAHKFMNIP